MSMPNEPAPLGINQIDALLSQIDSSTRGGSKLPSRQEVRFLVWSLRKMLAHSHVELCQKAHAATNVDSFAIDAQLLELLTQLSTHAKAAQQAKAREVAVISVFIAIAILGYAASGISANDFALPVPSAQRHKVIHLQNEQAWMIVAALASAALAALMNAWMYWWQIQRRTACIYLRGALVAACIGIHVIVIAQYATTNFYW